MQQILAAQRQRKIVRHLWVLSTEDSDRETVAQARRPATLARRVSDGGTEQSLQRMRVLLVEDSDLDATLFCDQLETVQGYEFDILTTTTVGEALVTLRTNDFEVVVLDLTLPDAWGLTAFDVMRQAAPHLPLVILTGSEDRSLSIKALEQGAANYLIKQRMTPERIATAIIAATHFKSS